MNTVRAFILESGKVRVGTPGSETGGQPTSYLDTMTLFRAYSLFSGSDLGVRPVSPKRFREMIKELEAQLGFRNVPGKGITGLTLVNEKAVF